MVGRSRLVRQAVAAMACAAGTMLVSACGLLPAQGVTAHPGSKLPLPTTQHLATVHVHLGTVLATVQSAGQLLPRQFALIGFHAGGQIKTLHMRNGQIVKRGAVLATLHTGTLPFQIGQQKLNIEQQQMAITALQQSAQLSPPVSQAQAAQRSVQLKRAQLQLQQMELTLHRLQIQLLRYEIIAPFTGRVTHLNVHLGSMVGPFQPIAHLSDVTAVRFVVHLPNLTVAQEVAPGQIVKLSLASVPGHAMYTTVNSVQIPTAQAVAIAKANQGLGGATAPQATLNPPSGFKLKRSEVGSAFTAQITVAQAPGVLYLPSTAIHAFNGLDYVNLYSKGQVVQRPVQLGLEGDGYTAVTAGLHDGQKVVQ